MLVPLAPLTPPVGRKRGRPILTTFRYKCFQNLLCTFGAVDAVVECLELAVRELMRETDKQQDFDAYINKKADENGIRVNTVSVKALRTRASQLHILSIYQQFEGYLEALKKESPKIKTLKDDNKKSAFKRILGVLGNESGLVSQLEIDILEYYRNVRHVFMHQEIKEDKYDSVVTKIKKKVNNEKNLNKLNAPNPFTLLDFDDFILFTKVAKDVAEKLCILARPSDEEIAELVRATPNFGKLKKYKNNPKRLRMALETLCRCEYSISKEEASKVVCILQGALA